MNVSREQSKSLWMDAPEHQAGEVKRDHQADIVVVGAGIAGLSAAYELATKGLLVVVVDRGPIARGMSARTTAHLSTVCDLTYDELIAKRGEVNARRFFESQAAAIDRIEEIQEKEGIACDFARLDGFLFAPDNDGVKMLEKEMEALGKAGIEGIHWAEAQKVDGSWKRALRFPRQGRFHPVKYMNALARRIEDLGSKVFANSAVTDLKAKDGEVTVVTENGSISAPFAITATNSPIGAPPEFHGKQGPYRTYAIAAEIARGSAPDGLFWDTLKPYHYVRVQPGKDSDHLIVGGEDHKSAEADDGATRIKKLEQWAREYFPAMGKTSHRWSGQIFEPADGVGFVGFTPGKDNVFLITGDSGLGMTHGVMAGMLIADMIRGAKNEWAELYAPDRKMPKSILEYVGENVSALKNLGDFISSDDVKSVDDLEPGQGAVIHEGKKAIAAFRDEDGKLHLKSAACTHLGCQLQWNSFERCWDCGCHGSQFAVDGTVLNAPATAPLDDPASQGRKKKEKANAK